MAWKKAQREKAEAEKNKPAESGASAAPEGGQDDGPPKPSKPLSEMSMAE